MNGQPAPLHLHDHLRAGQGVEGPVQDPSGRDCAHCVLIVVCRGVALRQSRARGRSDVRAGGPAARHCHWQVQAIFLYNYAYIAHRNQNRAEPGAHRNQKQNAQCDPNQNQNHTTFRIPIPYHSISNQKSSNTGIIDIVHTVTGYAVPR